MKTTQFDTTWYVEQERHIREASTQARASRPSSGIGQLYVVEFTSGVLKVGKAVRADSRIATHALHARIHRGDIARSWASGRHAGYDETERRLISGCKRLGQNAFGREYFRGVDFNTVCELAGRVVLDSQRRAYLDQLITAADGDLSTTWQDAHLRAFGESVTA